MIEILSLIITPFVILVLMILVEQYLEPIDYGDRILKSAWDTQVFTIGAQSGFVVEQTLGHDSSHWSWSILCLAAILFLTIVIGGIRYRKLHPRSSSLHPSITSNVASTMAFISLAITVMFMLTSH